MLARKERSSPQRTGPMDTGRPPISGPTSRPNGAVSAWHWAKPFPIPPPPFSTSGGSIGMPACSTSGAREPRGGAERGKLGENWGKTGGKLGKTGENWGKLGENRGKGEDREESGSPGFPRSPSFPLSPLQPLISRVTDSFPPLAVPSGAAQYGEHVPRLSLLLGPFRPQRCDRGTPGGPAAGVRLRPGETVGGMPALWPVESDAHRGPLGATGAVRALLPRHPGPYLVHQHRPRAARRRGRADPDRRAAAQRVRGLALRLPFSSPPSAAGARHGAERRPAGCRSLAASCAPD